MYICVTHVDARTGIPCDAAPMSHGPAFPKIKGLTIEFGNQTQWPTNKPLFFGTCDNDADVTVDGVVKVLTNEEYADEQRKENDTKALQVRQHREYLLRTQVDAINPMRWDAMPIETKELWKVYRQALLDVPQQDGFPWNVKWPQMP